jgi:hypothetical protein
MHPRLVHVWVAFDAPMGFGMEGIVGSEAAAEN